MLSTLFLAVPGVFAQGLQPVTNCLRERGYTIFPSLLEKAGFGNTSFQELNDGVSPLFLVPSDESLKALNLTMLQRDEAREVVARQVLRASYGTYVAGRLYHTFLHGFSVSYDAQFKLSGVDLRGLPQFDAKCGMHVQAVSGLFAGNGKVFFDMDVVDFVKTVAGVEVDKAGMVYMRAAQTSRENVVVAAYDKESHWCLSYGLRNGVSSFISLLCVIDV